MWFTDGIRPTGSPKALRLLVRWCTAPVGDVIAPHDVAEHEVEDWNIASPDKHVTEIALERCERTESQLVSVELAHMVALVELVLVFDRYSYSTLQRFLQSSLNHEIRFRRRIGPNGLSMHRTKGVDVIMKENNWKSTRSVRQVQRYIAQGTRLLQLCISGVFQIRFISIILTKI